MEVKVQNEQKLFKFDREKGRMEEENVWIVWIADDKEIPEKARKGTKYKREKKGRKKLICCIIFDIIFLSCSKDFLHRINTRSVSYIMPPIFFNENYNRYRKYNNACK
jgi:hypothetical protein